MKRLVFHLLLLASFTDRAFSQDASVELLRALKVEQQENRIVIAMHQGGELRFIDTTISNKGFRLTSQYAREISGPTLILKDGAETQSSYGKWSASCKHRGNCTVTNKQDTNKKFVLKFKGVVTPVYWSPDERFAFYVIKAPAFRFPPRLGFDDERDVIVYEISSGSHGILTTVSSAICDLLHWYQFEKPLPSRPELIKRP